VVRVESGPLEGLVGIVLRIKGTDRLVVSVSILMRSVSVEINRTCVRPLRDRNVRGTLEIPDESLMGQEFRLVSSTGRG